MKKILLNSSLLISFLEEESEQFIDNFNHLWDILTDDAKYPKYQGYISRDETKKFLELVERIYDGDIKRSISIVNKFLTVLETFSDEDKISFNYLLTEEEVVASLEIAKLNIEQFLTRYNLENNFSKSYDQGISEPLPDRKTDSITGIF
jgi:hypothetical protein